MVFSSLMAEQGVTRATGTDRETTCEKARTSAYEAYNIFRINPSCACVIVDAKAWMCELYFHYSSEKSKSEE